MSASLWPIRAARLAGTPVAAVRPATDRQTAYLASLHAERGWPVLDGDSLSADEASRLIDTALRTPRPAQRDIGPGRADVAAGRYAIPDPATGVLAFFQIDKPTEGKWTGYTFIQQQAGPETYPVRAAAYRDRGDGVSEWTAPAADPLADLITAATEAAEQLETVASQREDERQHGRAKVAHDHAEQLRAALRPYEAETGDQPHPWNATD